MKTFTFTVAVQSLNERDSYSIDAESLWDAVDEAIRSFNRTHVEKASSIQAEQDEVSIMD